MPPAAPAKAVKPAASSKASPGVSEGAEQEKAKTGAKPKAEAKPNEELVELLQKFDEALDTAQSYYVDFCRFVQKNEIGRAEVVASIMRARGCTFETAQSQFSRMKNILNNEEVLKELEDGKITLKVAREKTTKKQSNPKSATPQAVEEKYSKALKALVEACKERGFDLKSILASVEAEAKSAGIK